MRIQHPPINTPSLGKSVKTLYRKTVMGLLKMAATNNQETVDFLFSNYGCSSHSAMETYREIITEKYKKIKDLGGGAGMI